MIFVGNGYFLQEKRSRMIEKNLHHTASLILNLL